MSVIRDGVIVSPGVDSLIDETTFDAQFIEPGIYTLLSSKTILGETYSEWSVIVLSTNGASNPQCYQQLWLPHTGTTASQAIFIRNSTGNTYTEFTKMANIDNSAINKTGLPLEIYAQTTQPTAVSGRNILWIDTSV